MLHFDTHDKGCFHRDYVVIRLHEMVGGADFFQS